MFFTPMKKYLILVLVSVLLAPLVATTALADTPGDGFAVGDDCGFVMGIGETYASGTVDFTSVTNRNQGCVDESGYFYSDSARESYANYVYLPTGGTSTTYTMDFDWSTNANSNMLVDRTTGEWPCARGLNCNARFTSTSLSNRYVWFDWDCADISGCTAADAARYHVYTDVDTGLVYGYAWSDVFGFISFNDNNDNLEITQEMPPREITTWVDVLTYDEDSSTWITPEDADYNTAALADGSDYWKIRVQFEDSVSGFLTEDDIDTLKFRPVRPRFLFI